MLKPAISMVRTLASAGIGTGGPSVASMVTSLRLAILGALVTWNLVLAGVVLVVHPRVPALMISALHLALAGVCALAFRGKVRVEVCLVLGFAVWMIDYLVARSIDDAVTLAACWLGDLLYLGSAIVLRSRARTWLPLLASVVVVAVIVTVSPIWDMKTASAFVVTSVAIVVTVRFAMPGLWNLAEAADKNASALEAQRQAETLARRMSAEAAEDTRVLHDAVINTLGAVANSGPHIPMLDAMRTRCRRDLAVVEEMLEGRRERRRDFTLLGTGHGTIRVERTGLTDADLDELGDLMGADVADALLSAVDEAVRNVGKHAGVDRAIVDVHRSETGVRARVIDHGVGFEPSSSAGHGLTESIHGRVRAVGGDVAITSEIGKGTELAIDLPLHRRLDRGAMPDATTGVSEVASGLIRRACWLLGAGTVAVGVVIELGNRPGVLTWTYAMLAMVGLCIAVSYVAMRRRNTLPWPLAGLLCVALSLSFVAGMAGIDFGRTHVLTYQAIGIVPILVILLSMARVQWALLAASGLVVTASVLIALMWAKSADLGLITLVGLMPALGLSIGWWGFEGLVTRTIEESEELRRNAFAASVDAAIQIEVAQARQRWGTASLERAGALLKGIGHADLDPTDATVQNACAAEERYLRQFLLLNPKSYRMSVWFAHALAVARSRGVALTVRSGDQDAPDSGAAEALGNVVLEAINRAPEDAAVTVAWLPTSGGVRLSIVAPTSEAEHASGEALELPESWTVVRTVIADREMVEVLVS